MKIIITRNTRVDGKSVVADLKKAVEVSKEGGKALLACGKAILPGKGKPSKDEAPTDPGPE